MSNFLRDDGTFAAVTAGGAGALAVANNLSELTPSASTARASISAAQSGANTDITSATSLIGKDDLSGEIRAPEAKTYEIILDSQTNRTITKLTTKARVGSAVITPKIGSTTLGGGASTATTSKSSVTHTTSNAMTSGDELSFVVSSVSTDCEDVAFTLWFTKPVS